MRPQLLPTAQSRAYARCWCSVVAQIVRPLLWLHDEMLAEKAECRNDVLAVEVKPAAGRCSRVVAVSAGRGAHSPGEASSQRLGISHSRFRFLVSVARLDTCTHESPTRHIDQTDGAMSGAKEARAPAAVCRRGLSHAARAVRGQLENEGYARQWKEGVLERQCFARKADLRLEHGMNAGRKRSEGCCRVACFRGCAVAGVASVGTAAVAEVARLHGARWRAASGGGNLTAGR